MTLLMHSGRENNSNSFTTLEVYAFHKCASLSGRANQPKNADRYEEFTVCNILELEKSLGIAERH